jgi:hypothetical protein
MRMIVHLADEAPRIGAGWRIVEVEVGRKWVRLKDGSGQRGKIPVARWRQLERTAEVLPPPKRRRKRRGEPVL